MIFWGCPDELNCNNPDFDKRRADKRAECGMIVDMTDNIPKACTTYWHCSGPVKYEIRKVKP